VALHARAFRIATAQAPGDLPEAMTTPRDEPTRIDAPMRRLPLVRAARPGDGSARDAAATHAHAPGARRSLDAQGALQPRPAWFAAVPERLEDAHGRPITYLRVSITDRCDLACVYCMPPDGEHDHARRAEQLDLDELARLLELFARSGVRRVRLTGGEPLVRRDVVPLVARLRARHPTLALAMTTNGTRLAALAAPLREAGLDAVNVSLDALDPALFHAITRGGDVTEVIAGICAAQDAGLAVKLNTVLLGGVNDAEIPGLVDFAWRLGATPRFIELMPLGEGARLPQARFVTAAQALAPIAHRLRDDVHAGESAHGPARYRLAADGSERRVGVITALSDVFCNACNRVRLTARGALRACLASTDGVPLGDLLRAGASDLDLAWHVHAALGSKAAGHGFLDATRDAHTRVGMSLVGG
jgi:cyclic pyranopterin phosphate synthase